MSKMSKAEFNRIFGLLALDIRKRVAKSLLAGNDTGCFTTEQYKTHYCNTAWKTAPPTVVRWQTNAGTCLAVEHLRSIPETVREVSPGVWAAADEVAARPAAPKRKTR
jgi:hypothetical protein